MQATASLLNITEGVLFSFKGLVLENFYPEDTIWHTSPGNPQSPTLNDSMLMSLLISNGETIQSQWENGFEAVSALIMSNEVINDFAMDVSINAKTEWVLTFPTKRYYVNAEQVLAPFEDLYNGQTGSCDVFSTVVWDRESHQDIFIDLGDPPAPNTISQFCWSSNVVTFQDLFESPFSQTDILGSSNKHLLLVNGENGANGIDFENGYASIQFNHSTSRAQTIDSTQSQTYFGLPVIGFAIQNYANNNAQPGLLAQYGGSFKHKYKKEIVLNE